MDKNNLPQRKGAPSTAGFILIGIGVFILFTQIAPGFFSWIKSISVEAYNVVRGIFSWQIFLIFIGLFVGYRRNFKQPFGWLIPIVIGIIFLIKGSIGWNILLPILLISIGIVVLLNSYLSPVVRPTEPSLNDNFNTSNTAANPDAYEERFADDYGGTTTVANEEANNNTTSNAEANTSNNFSQANNQSTNTQGGIPQFVESVNIFSGSNRKVSGVLLGGDIVSIFGGAEINLLNATLENTVVIEITQIFGGTKIAIPAHWQVINQMTTLMGGIEDKRPPVNFNNLDGKAIVLKGVTIMGGVDIRNY